MPYAAVAVLVGLLVALAQGWRHDAGVERLKREHGAELSAMRDAHAAALQAIQDHANQQIDAARAAQQLAMAEVAALDDRLSKELAYARDENLRLADAVDAGNRRLRVQAQCPADGDPGGGGSPSASPTSGLVDGTSVELSPAARRAYFRLRAGIVEDTQKILGLQAYLRTLIAYCSPPAGEGVQP